MLAQRSHGKWVHLTRPEAKITNAATAKRSRVSDFHTTGIRASGFRTGALSG